MWRATPKHFPKSGEWSALAHTDGHPDSGAHHVRGGGGGGRAQKRGCGPPQPPTPTKASRRPRREPRCSMTAMRPPCSGSRWPSRAGPRALPARSVSLPKGRYGQMGGPGSAFPRARKAVGAARQSTRRDYQAQSTGEKQEASKDHLMVLGETQCGMCHGLPGIELDGVRYANGCKRLSRIATSASSGPTRKPSADARRRNRLLLSSLGAFFLTCNVLVSF